MEIRSVKIKEIRPYDRNAKKHDDTQINNVAESIRQFGFVQPIVIDSNGVIVIGHCRFEAAKRLKYVEVPCIMVDDLTPEQVDALRIVDNKTNESPWDIDLLEEELQDLDLSMFDFAWDLMEETAEATEITEDEAPEVDKTNDPISKFGQIWKLGRHRLMCGDSTSEENVKALLGGAKADLLLTDPPYGVDYTGKTKDALKIQNDAKTDEEMQDWLANHKQSFGNSWAAGDIMYEDLNGDGEVNEGSNTITDSGDKKIIGNSSPRYKFGIDLDASWNGFDIRLFFQGIAKRDYWLGDNMFWGASGGLWQSTCFMDHLDFFRSEGDDWGSNLNAYFPRPILDGGKNQKKQTRYLQNAAYLRLKNLQIGYTLPSSLTNKAGLSKLRVFLSVENLFTISGLPDSFDPETLGSGYGNWNGAVTESAKSYPLSRTVSTGLSVTF